MANTNTEIIAMLETNPSQAIRGVLDTLYLYNPATVNDLIAQLNDVINKVGFEAIVVDALPETGKKGTIYFVPSGGETPNIYNEYVWVTETEKFEIVGSAQVDLSNYYTKEEVDNALKGLDPLPDQTDNAGKFLTTDGTTASWSDRPLVNKSTNSTSYVVTTTSNSLTTTVGYSVCLGDISTAKSPRSVVVGYSAGTGTSVTDSTGQIAIGPYAFCGGIGAIALGGMAAAGGWPLNNYAIALGSWAKSKADYAIQLGSTGSSTTNTDANTFKVANSNGNFEMMSADGTVPTDRYTTTPTTAGTYVPKLTIAEDGTTTREWGTASGGGVSGDYLPLSGGTLTGKLGFTFEVSTHKYNVYFLELTRTWSNGSSTHRLGYNGTEIVFSLLGLEQVGNITPGASNTYALGSQNVKWANVYTKKLNNGADLNIPTEGGTLARLEDLEDVVTIKEYD